MKYELSDEQIKVLMQIIQNTSVRVIEMPIINDLIKSLNNPIVEKEGKK